MRPDDESPPRLAEALDGLRRREGWSQRRLAEALGIHHATVGRWEMGLVRPTPALLERLGRLVDASFAPSPPDGESIREKRLRLGLSQADLAQRVGVAQPTLSRIEGGSLRPGPALLARLREELGELAAGDELARADRAQCEASYEAYWRACGVFDRPDGPAWGAALTRRLVELERDGEDVGPLLARVSASRAYWALARGRHRDVARLARPALEVGRTRGFDLTSGYALWALARSRFTKPRTDAADRRIVGSLARIAHRQGAQPYATLIAAAHDALSGRLDDADDALQALSERPFAADEGGQFGGLSDEERWGTYQSYRGMFALAAGRTREVVQLTGRVPEGGPVVRLLYVSYRNAALRRLGCPDESSERQVAEFAESSGHAFAYGTVLDHVRRLSGV